ncbi:Hpt domain-containing protein, partial [Treponema sp. R80B11-R83G3]
VGMREMFIEKGFNDFLSKPIDVSKLDEILDRWIPEEKRAISNEQLAISNEQLAISNEKLAIGNEKLAIGNEKLAINNEKLLDIPGVNTAKGLAMTGGKEAGYIDVLSIFCKDVEKRLSMLKTVPQEGDLPAFIINVHALKSACASIGATEVSAMAKELEAAGKAADLSVIEKQLPAFTGQLAELAGNILTVTEAYVAHNANEALKSSKNEFAVFIPLLRELDAALKTKKVDDIDKLLEELIKRQDADSDVKNALEKISDEVLMTEFDNAERILEELISQITKGK